jgi:hypothetical protein
LSSILLKLDITDCDVFPRDFAIFLRSMSPDVTLLAWGWLSSYFRFHQEQKSAAAGPARADVVVWPPEHDGAVYLQQGLSVWSVSSTRALRPSGVDAARRGLLERCEMREDDDGQFRSTREARRQVYKPRPKQKRRKTT